MVAPIPVRHLQSIFPRTNAHVLADILIAEGELSRLRLIAGRELTPWEDARWSDLEDTISECRDELRAMIEQQTGLDWDALLGAMQ